ncbi:hypothetical protein GCM10009118_05020 [Wandonia haliotis]|uniref:Uncharacterized protein n=1 Tax=Wandonia haliotis TaxID=574963 RepID=A0ABN1MLJ3_9FLAO
MFEFAGILTSLFITAVSLLISVLFLLTLNNTLKEVSPENRLVPYNNVWLMLIPLFNVFYAFYLYPKLCDSIKAEFEARGIEEKGDYGKTIGLVLASITIALFIEPIQNYAQLVSAVLLIIFWVKISGYKNKLINTPKGIDMIGKDLDD